jgi:hypothetical protein
MVAMIRALVGLALAAAVLVTGTAAAGEDELLQACFNAVNAGTYDLACQLCEKATAETSGPSRDVARINLARCEESRGHLVRALEHYRTVRGGMSADDDRRVAIDERIAAIIPRIAHLRLDWSGAAAGVELLVDGAVVSGRPAQIDLDPGEHTAVVRLAGHDAATSALTAADGATLDLLVQPGPETPMAPEPGPGTQWIAGWVVGGIGVLGIVAFAVTGGLVLDRQATVDELCPERADGRRVCSEAAGVEAADEGKVLGVVNAVSLGVGGAGLAAGLLLLLTAPDDTVVGVDVDSRGAMIQVGARF